MTDIVERLRGLYDKWNSPHSSPDGLPTGASVMLDAADEIKRLRARDKDLTLEGLGLIGRIEQARDALAGTDAASLPRDYPLERMAQDRMAEIERLRAALREVRELNMTATDANGHQWANSDMIEQIIVSVFGGDK